MRLRTRTLIACAALAACQQDGAEPVTEPGTEVAPPTTPPPGGSTAGPAAPKPTPKEAGRFLIQASFGAAPGDAARVEELGYAGWIAEQAALPVVPYLPRLEGMNEPRRDTVYDLFWEGAIEGEDQLRARVAYALANIVTVSLEAGRFGSHPETFAHYHDALTRQALGNYTDLVREVSLSPAMGVYLSSLGNRRADQEAGIAPDENYARELMQLFTIGLEELGPDGTPKGAETYDVADVQGLAAVFTGLSWADTDFEHPRVRGYNQAVPMESFRSFHETEPKAFLGRTVDVGGDAMNSVDVALDHLLEHENLAPFVAKQLIQHLVTSNPSPAYVARVGAAFEAGRLEADGHAFGEGRRGDMLATVAAILLDEEARSPAVAAEPGHGRLRDPVLRFAHLARAYRDEGGARRAGAPEDTGAMRHADDPDKLGQAPLGPPSVFGWYRPGYVSPGGWTAKAGGVSPEMQLATGSNVTGYVGWMGRTVRSEVWGTEFFDLDTSSLTSLTDDPAALVDAVAMDLTADAMEPATRARIAAAVGLVEVDERDTEKDRRHRVQLALLMAVTSPEFAVQR